MIETVHTNNQGAFQPDNNSVKTRNKCNRKFGSSKFNAIYKNNHVEVKTIIPMQIEVVDADLISTTFLFSSS